MLSRHWPREDPPAAPSAGIYVPLRSGGTIGGHAPSWPRVQPSRSSPHPINPDSDNKGPHPRCLSPTPRRYVRTDGDWQLQDHPGAPGTARQGRTRTIVSTNDGGKATQPRAPGHERPRAARCAARHGRLSAALRAPGADVPLATTARAPGQHRLRAAPRAPGHERPLAAQRAAGRDRLSAALRAPGADVPLATTARAPGQHRLRAAPIATVPSPAGLRRLRQAVLPRVPANPRNLTYPQSHHTASSFPRQRKSGHVPTNAVGAQHVAPVPPPRGGTTGGPNGRPSRSASAGAAATTHQVHPAIQVPPHPRSCSTVCTGFPLQHPARAPPTTARRP